MDPRGGLKKQCEAIHPSRMSFRAKRENFVIYGQGLTLFPHVPRTSPLSSSVFPAASLLSAPLQREGWRYESAIV